MDGGNWIVEKLPPYCKTLTNFITYNYIEYTPPLAAIKLTTLMMIDTDVLCRCK